MKKTTIQAKGMHCPSCEKIIEKVIRKAGAKANADYVTESVKISYDPTKITKDELIELIEAKGYDCSVTEQMDGRPIGLILGILGIFLIAYFALGMGGISLLEIEESLPQITPDMGYGLLFLVGLFTGFHCVSMCGGFVVSYTTKSAQEGKSTYRSHAMYGLGKTVSYTLIGAAFGLLGSIIAFTPMMRGVAGILAGLFLVLFGLKMFNIFPSLRRLNITTPKFVSRFVGEQKRHTSNPLIIGLLNGLMIACGPLQAIYIMAAGTGSMIEGAKLLFVFGLGTLPVLLGFGFITSFISSKATTKLLKASGALVIIFGLVMINTGLALTGTGLDTTSLTASVSVQEVTEGTVIEIEEGYQIIEMEVNRYGWSPDRFVLKKGVPVKWIIDGKEINGCNNAIQVPKLGLEFDIVKGEQIIEFTPDKEGVISWSCWMGMIPGVFVVKDDIELVNNAVAADVVKEEVAKVAVPKASSCDGSCGSSTCGGGTPRGCGCGG